MASRATLVLWALVGLVSLALAIAGTPTVAEEEPPPTAGSVTITLDQGSQDVTADAHREAAMVEVSGRVQAEFPYAEDIDLSVSGTDWDTTITTSAPITKRRTHDFTFTARIVVPQGTSPDTYELRIVAEWQDDVGEVTYSETADFRIHVEVPFLLGSDTTYQKLDPGGTARFTLTLIDRTASGTSYLLDTGELVVTTEPPWLPSIFTFLDVARLTLDAGGQETFTLEVHVPANATASTISVPVVVTIEGAPEYSRQVDLMVEVEGPVVPPPPGGGDDTWLPFDQWVVLSIIALALVVGVVGFLGGTEVGFLALLWFLLPMFTRLKRREVLNQFTRGEIYGFIKANPGIHLTAIKENLELSNGVLAYHLRVLVREEFIVARREGGYKRFYPRDMRVPRKRVHFTRLQLDILEKLRLHPGSTQAALAKMLGESKQVINYNIKVLITAEAVRIERDGGKTLCYVEKDAPSSAGAAEGEEAIPVTPVPSPTRWD